MVLLRGIRDTEYRQFTVGLGRIIFYHCRFSSLKLYRMCDL